MCHQAAMVGLGVDFADVTDYVAENDLGTAVLLRVAARRRLDRPARAREQHGRVRRGPGSVRASTASVRPPPRAIDALDAGQFEPTCPQCGRALEPDLGSRGRAARSPKRLRRDQAPPGAPVQRLRSRAPRRHRHRAAISQRVRAADAARHALRRGREHLSQRATNAAMPPHVYEDGGPAPRLHPRARHRPRQRARARRRARAGGAFNIATGSPHTVLDMATQLGAAFGTEGPVPKVTGAWARRGRRHVFADPGRAAELLDFRAEVDFDDGIREFATAELRR